MLLGNDVLDVESGRGGSEIGKAAVFTLTGGPVTDKLAEWSWHQASGDRLRRDRALAWSMEMKSMVWT